MDTICRGVSRLCLGVCSVVMLTACPQAPNSSQGSTGTKGSNQANSVAAMPQLPTFILACSYGGGNAFYRVASNGRDIYFASIVNENNLRSTKKSNELTVTDREIKATISSPNDPGNELLIIDRATLNVSISYFVSTDLYPPDGFNRLRYMCESVEDSEILSTLESYHNSAVAEQAEKRKIYDARPNKL